jgi:hypothetical protein
LFPGIAAVIEQSVSAIENAVASRGVPDERVDADPEQTLELRLVKKRMIAAGGDPE